MKNNNNNKRTKISTSPSLSTLSSSSSSSSSSKAQKIVFKNGDLVAIIAVFAADRVECFDVYSKECYLFIDKIWERSIRTSREIEPILRRPFQHLYYPRAKSYHLILKRDLFSITKHLLDRYCPKVIHTQKNESTITTPTSVMSKTTTPAMDWQRVHRLDIESMTIPNGFKFREILSELVHGKKMLCFYPGGTLQFINIDYVGIRYDKNERNHSDSYQGYLLEDYADIHLVTAMCIGPCSGQIPQLFLPNTPYRIRQFLLDQHQHQEVKDLGWMCGDVILNGKKPLYSDRQIYTYVANYQRDSPFGKYCDYPFPQDCSRCKKNNILIANKCESPKCRAIVCSDCQYIDRINRNGHALLQRHCPDHEEDD